jgi:hypothetical protein
MSNQMILEFAHRRIQELHEELRDMENIIEAFTSYDDEMGVNGMCVMNIHNPLNMGVRPAPNIIKLNVAQGVCNLL